VSVAVLIGVIGWDSLTPGCTTLKINVIDVSASIDDVYIDSITAIGRVEILVECPEL